MEVYANSDDYMSNGGGELVNTYLKDIENEDVFSENGDEIYKYSDKVIPKRLSIRLKCDKKEYNCYIWFDGDKISSIFEHFYGAHLDTKTDFIIRIDAENKKYELSLYRQGLKEPRIIPEEAYQLIVFKNKFEDYRSDNYNQKSGAWVW